MSKTRSMILCAALCAGAGSGALFSRSYTAEAATAADFPVETDIGGGQPSRILIENAKLRVTLVEFKKGTTRPGNLRRRSDQLIIYIDYGRLTQDPPPGVPPVPPQDRLNCNSEYGCGPVRTDGTVGGGVPPGSIAFRPKGSLGQTLRVQEDYRALYVELK